MKRQFVAASPDWTRFVTFIEDWRTRSRLTQREAANKAHMSGSQYNRLVSKGKDEPAGRSIERPAYQDVMNLGLLAGLTPNQIAEMVGIWTPQEESGIENTPKVRSLLAMLVLVPSEQREPLTDFMLNAVSGAVRPG